MRKTLVFLLILGGVLSSLVEALADPYSVSHRSDKERSFVFSVIKDESGQIIARFCLVDPKPFYFYSLESDPDLFPNIEANASILANRKKRGQLAAMIMVDFSSQAKIKRPFNLKYLFNYLVIISFAPPYLRKVEILSPSRFSRMFFVETKINGQNYFGALELNRPFDDGGAKKLINQIKGAGEISTIVPVLDNVPVKFVSFDGDKKTVLYESKPGHRNYTGVFLAGSQ